MFTKLLIKALKKRFSKLPEKDKEELRGMVNNETISVKPSKKKVNKRRKKMAEENEVKKETETQDVEVKEAEGTTSTEKVDDKSQETKADGKEDKVDESTKSTEKTEEVQTDNTQVQETEPQGNGIRVEDLVTKDELSERLAAMEARMDAVLKENKDLTEKYTAMQDKYENKDFGTLQNKGMVQKDKDAESTFEAYSRQFM